MGQDGEVVKEGEESNTTTAGSGVSFVSVEFEVYGHVQGIYTAIFFSWIFFPISFYLNVQHLPPSLALFSSCIRPRLRWY